MTDPKIFTKHVSPEDLGKVQVHETVTIFDPLAHRWLFLDFDGVLNGINYWHGQERSGLDILQFPFSPHNILAINQVVDQFDDLLVVITSAWRDFGFYEGYIEAKLDQAGFNGKVWATLDTQEKLGNRGIAIQTWMVNNGLDHPDLKMCIIDDRPHRDFGWLNGYLVQTTMEKGFLYPHVALATDMLRGKSYRGDVYGKPVKWSEDDKK